jgi:hypothetical protein
MAKKPMLLSDLFHETLKDIYFAENKIIKTLPKMAIGTSEIRHELALIVVHRLPGSGGCRPFPCLRPEFD